MILEKSLILLEIYKYKAVVLSSLSQYPSIEILSHIH